VTGPTREPFLIGGMDAGYEDLLLDAGGQLLTPSPATGEARSPAVLLHYGPSRRPAMDTALGVCRDNNWLISTPERGDDSLVVSERSVVRALRRLGALGVSPDRIIVRSVDILPAQAQGVRQALSPGSTLEITG
jgi:hypothetical protein